MNPWVEHIRKFAIANKTNYSCALANPYCGKTYRDKSLPLNENKNYKTTRTRKLKGAIY
jgi:hypothetical protein